LNGSEYIGKLLFGSDIELLLFFYLEMWFCGTLNAIKISAKNLFDKTI
jgi:hypothetical protein